MTPCSLVELVPTLCSLYIYIYRSSDWRAFCLPPAYSMVCWTILRPWRWRRYFPPKRRVQLNGLHGVISQKMIPCSLVEESTASTSLPPDSWLAYYLMEAVCCSETSMDFYQTTRQIVRYFSRSCWFLHVTSFSFGATFFWARNSQDVCFCPTRKSIRNSFKDSSFYKFKYPSRKVLLTFQRQWSR
jgi:hypothetical protein